MGLGLGLGLGKGAGVRVFGLRAYQRLEVCLANGLVPAEDGAHAYGELGDGDRAAAVSVKVLEALLLRVRPGIRGGSRATTA